MATASPPKKRGKQPKPQGYVKAHKTAVFKLHNPSQHKRANSNLLHLIRRFYLLSKEVRRSVEWLIRQLIKVGAKVVYRGRRWHVHVALAYPLTRH